MTYFTELAAQIIRVIAGIGVTAYGIAALVTVADIMGRRIGYPIGGVVDLVQLFVITGAWLVIPFAFLTAAHVSVDFLVAMMPRPLKVPLRVLATLMSLVLLALMLRQGYQTFETRTMFGDTSQQLGIPIAWYWYPLLAGLAFSIIAVISELSSA